MSISLQAIRKVSSIKRILYTLTTLFSIPFASQSSASPATSYSYILSQAYQIKKADCQLLKKNQLTFIPERKAYKGQWQAETGNPSRHIILSAGHVNRISGTTGFNNQSLIFYNGHKHTTEAALTKIVTPFMVKVGRERGFSVEQFIAESTDFKQATLELAHYERITKGIAFEIHSDVPSEGYHRASGYDGQTGIIPPVDGTITPAEACAGTYLGKFKKGMRGLYAPKQGISLFELFPTNKEITHAVHQAIKTDNYSRVKQLVLPFIHLFYDALEQGGIKSSLSQNAQNFRKKYH